MFGPTNLAGIRRQFVTLSGHYGLVNDPPTDSDPGCKEDSGADYYINVGQRILDRLRDNPGTRRSYLYDTAEGDISIDLTGCRTIETVWRSTSDGKQELTFLEPAEMRSRYSTERYSEVDSDIPAYWTHITRSVPGQLSKTASDFTYPFDDIQFGEKEQVGGIVIMPPADGVYTIEVYGRWFSKVLNSNEDKSWWTLNEPDILVQGALAAMEMHFRNTQGVLDYFHPVTGTITILFNGITKDSVEDDVFRTGKRIVG